jgi:hypothetical protein
MKQLMPAEVKHDKYADHCMCPECQKAFVHDALTPAEEAYVRERWTFVIHSPNREIVLCNSGSPVPFDNWRAAYLFTKKREEEIADLEVDIEWLEDQNSFEVPQLKRILAREQASLAELKRGMKEQG